MPEPQPDKGINQPALQLQHQPHLLDFGADDVAVREKLLSCCIKDLVDIIIRQRGKLHSLKSLYEAYCHQIQMVQQQSAMLAEMLSASLMLQNKLLSSSSLIKPPASFPLARVLLKQPKLPDLVRLQEAKVPEGCDIL